MTTDQADRIYGPSGGVAIKAPCRVATTANITLSGLQTIDGITLVADDRVLVKNQTNTVDNGIWVAGSGTWSRAKDFDGSRDVVTGTRVFVTNGTTNANAGFVVTTVNPVYPGTSNITFTTPTLVSATLIGGTGSSSTLTLESTSAAANGANTDAILFKTSNMPGAAGSNPGNLWINNRGSLLYSQGNNGTVLGLDSTNPLTVLQSGSASPALSTGIAACVNLTGALGTPIQQQALLGMGYNNCSDGSGLAAVQGTCTAIYPGSIAWAFGGNAIATGAGASIAGMELGINIFAAGTTSYGIIIEYTGDNVVGHNGGNYILMKSLNTNNTPINGIQFGDGATDTAVTGTLISTNAVSCQVGIDLTGNGSAYSQYAFKSPGATIDGSGNVSIPSLITSKCTTPASAPAGVAGTLFQLIQADSVATTALLDAFGAAPTVIGRRAQGTAASPTQMTINQPMLIIGAEGYQSGGAYSTATRADIRMIAAESWTSTAQGTYVAFRSTPATTASSVEVMRIGAFGALCINTTSDDGTNKLIVSGGTSLLGTIAKYNSIATAGLGVPAIYGQGRVTGQTAAAASIATYTVGAADGSFHVSANVLVTASTTHNFTVTCTYTDEGNTSRTLTFNFSNAAGTIATSIANAGGTVPYHGVPMHIRAKASTAITVATTGTFSSVTYNAEANITQLA